SEPASTPRFDPVIQKLLARFEANLARPFDPKDLATMRERFGAAPQRPPTIADGVSVTDVEAGGVKVRLYRPDAAGPLPLHRAMQGGGFVMGQALSGAFDSALSRRAAAAGCLVASVEYRLAPEHRFPAGLEDCYAAFVALAAEAGRHGIAPQAVSVGGASS